MDSGTIYFWLGIFLIALIAIERKLAELAREAIAIRQILEKRQIEN